MVADLPVITLGLTVLGLFVAALTLMVAWQQGRAANTAASLADHAARLQEIETIHAAQMADLERKLTALDEDNLRHQLHVEHCEDELAHIRQLLQAREVE